jgi:iron complex outermembrane receptor protein
MGDWKGYFDVSGFINQYSNMVEFTFGIYNPDTIALTTDPNDDLGYILNWVGFQAQNAERARIAGVELSFNSMGKIGDVELTSLLGYTYMDPVSLNQDSVYRQTFSDTSVNLLKYRFRHLAKVDVQATYKKFFVGFSCRYNSFMQNIDAVFEEDVDPTDAELYILPGLAEYRNKFNKGSFVVDTRMGYSINDAMKINFIANNLLNAEYVTRPGDIQPPRSFVLQLQFQF